MRRAALACGHCADLEGGPDIPRELDCAGCRRPVRVLVIWPVGADGNIVHWHDM